MRLGSPSEDLVKTWAGAATKNDSRERRRAGRNAERQTQAGVTDSSNGLTLSALIFTHRFTVCVAPLINLWGSTHLCLMQTIAEMSPSGFFYKLPDPTWNFCSSLSLLFFIEVFLWIFFFSHILRLRLVPHLLLIRSCSQQKHWVCMSASKNKLRNPAKKWVHGTNKTGP